MGGEHYITYSAYSRHGVRIGLAKTHDFTTVERVSLISQPDMRNVVIFPEIFDGRYARLDRPHSEINPWSIWLSWSPDLIHWGESTVAIKPRRLSLGRGEGGSGSDSDRHRQGLAEYLSRRVRHNGRCGVSRRRGTARARRSGQGNRGRGRVDPRTPRIPWELTGYVHNVVFCCGAVPEEDGTVKLYWGGADSVMCAGTAQVQELVDLCLQKPRSTE